MNLNPVRNTKAIKIKNKISGGVKIGCCGFPVSKVRYFNNFKVVELQQTFYQPPKLETVIKWKRAAPVEFEFCLKAWQLITHQPTSPTYRKLTEKIPNKILKNYGFFKPTDEVFSAWETTERVANTLKAKVVVFQCPASFTPIGENKNNLKRFFKKIKRRDFLFAWEPRGNWQEKDIEDLCKELDLIHCVDPFKVKLVYGKIGYFRLHGIKNYKYCYTDADLIHLIKLITHNSKLITYIMFNNVYMFEDALRFKNILFG